MQKHSQFGLKIFKMFGRKLNLLALMKNLFGSGPSTFPTVSPDFQPKGRTWSNTLLSIATVSLFCFLTSGHLSAKSKVSYQPPYEVSNFIKDPILSGKGELSVFLFYIYDAYLWVEKRPWSFDQKFALSITYKRNITKQELVDSSIDEMERYYNLGSKLSNYREVLGRIFPDVKPGDRISALYTPQVGLKFYQNVRYIGEIRDNQFAQRFINIWLHPNAHYSDLRHSLLYGAS